MSRAIPRGPPDEDSPRYRRYRGDERREAEDLEPGHMELERPYPRTMYPPVPMTLTNLFQYLSFTSPFLVIFFITLLAIMQNSLEKGLIFNMGIVLVSVLVIIVKNILKSKQNKSASPFCNVLPRPFTSGAEDIYDNPSLSSAILSFSSMYLIWPMIVNNQQNYILLIVLLTITCINAVVEWYMLCSGIMGILIGILLGVGLGIGYYYLINLSKSSKLVYFNEQISNNIYCSKPSKQNFKCELYKDGEPIRNNL